MLNDLSEIVAIDTVEAPRSAADAPFGKNLRAALDWFLNKASSYGLKVGEYEGYYGWAEYGEPEKPLIGILGHIDVVPAGGGWQTDPFKMVSEDGKVYGRGVADDKGPLVTCLHLLKKFREDNVKFNHRIRLIVGCNEETGSLCLKKYAEVGEIPAVSLVPDSDFPVINSEKGILHTDAVISPDALFLNSVLSINAGERANVIPDAASVVLKADGEAVKALRAIDANLTADVFHSPKIVANLVGMGASLKDFAIETADGNVKITASGVAGHAMAPDKADNALWKIFALLNALIPDSDTVKKVFSNFCRSDAALTTNIFREDKESGKLTMNMGVARFDGEKLTLKFDFRLPLCANPDETEKLLQAALPENTVIKRARFAENLYIPQDSPLIKTLLRVYAEETGEPDPKPIQTGGGTYARELPNAVAFGPTPLGTETDIHNADEHIEVALLYKMFDIYYKAIAELDKIY